MEENNVRVEETAVKTKFCKHCGAKIPEAAVICTSCGCQVEEIKGKEQPNIVINNSKVFCDIILCNYIDPVYCH